VTDERRRQRPRGPLQVVRYFRARALGVNLWCAGVVVRRRRELGRVTPDVTRRETDRVLLSVKLGVPPALVAPYLGFRLIPG
jgi:hypothetical protein